MDEFADLRKATRNKEQAILAWEAEVKKMRLSGWSTRAIADPAGVSHMTVWELTRD